MRTTIEIRDEFRARLLAIAARRGEKGFSHIVEEALERFLTADEGRATALKRALETRGALSEAEASELEARTAVLRENWR